MTGLLSVRAILPGAPNPIWIRTAGEGDVDGLAVYFGKLSRAARYNRFMGAVGDLSARARDCLMPSRKSDFFTLVAERRAWTERRDRRGELRLRPRRRTR